MRSAALALSILLTSTTATFAANHVIVSVSHNLWGYGVSANEAEAEQRANSACEARLGIYKRAGRALPQHVPCHRRLMFLDSWRDNCALILEYRVAATRPVLLFQGDRGSALRQAADFMGSDRGRVYQNWSGPHSTAIAATMLCVSDGRSVTEHISPYSLQLRSR